MSLFREPLSDLQNSDGRPLLSGLLQHLQWLVPGSTRESHRSNSPDAVAHIIVSTSPASRLKGALGVIDVNNWKGKALNVVSLVEFGGVAATFGQLLSPKVRYRANTWSFIGVHLLPLCEDARSDPLVVSPNDAVVHPDYARALATPGCCG
jgi:hypothetical protein